MIFVPEILTITLALWVASLIFPAFLFATGTQHLSPADRAVARSSVHQECP